MLKLTLSGACVVAILAVSGCHMLQTGRSEGETAIRHEESAKAEARMAEIAAQVFDQRIESWIWKWCKENMWLFLTFALGGERAIKVYSDIQKWQKARKEPA